MNDAVREQTESSPDPSPELVPIGPRQLEQIDENLHLGWSWHRYRYVYRRFDAPRILDAGCGTGLSTLGLARLHPGATVRGVDGSPRALEIAQERLAASAPELGTARVEFAAHDLQERLSAGPAGGFDFLVCRNVLHLVEEPERVLANLAAAADDRGLLLVTVPAPPLRHAIRQVRRVVELLAAPGASLEARTELGFELFRALRPEHPLRQLEGLVSGPAGPTPARIRSGYLGPEGRDLELEDLIGLLERSGWRFLYEVSPHPWQPERVFQTHVAPMLKERAGGLDDAGLAVLRDALDPARPLHERRVYACLADHEPHVAAWPDLMTSQPQELDRLIPHRSGLVGPLAPREAGAATPPVPTPVVYRVVSGATGPVDPLVDAYWNACDGRRSCGEIVATVQAHLGLSEAPDVARSRWLELANRGFVLLEPPDPRQHVDCIHLGAVRSRLDCPCPRKWIRACERYDNCTIDLVDVDSPTRAALEKAASDLRIPVETLAVCMQCADYVPEE